MFHFCLELLVDFQLAATVGFQADVFQTKFFGVTRSTIGPKQRFCFHLLAAFQMQDHPIIDAFDAINRFVVPNDDALVAQVIRKCIGDFVIQELKQLATRVDQVDFDPQVAKHRCVFGADHASPVDRDRSGFGSHPQDRIAVVNIGMIKIDIGRSVRPRAGRDHKILGSNRITVRSHRDRVGIQKSSRSAQYRYVVAIIKRLPHRNLLGDDRLRAAF